VFIIIIFQVLAGRHGGRGGSLRVRTGRPSTHGAAAPGDGRRTAPALREHRAGTGGRVPGRGRGGQWRTHTRQGRREETACGGVRGRGRETGRRLRANDAGPAAAGSITAWNARKVTPVAK
jgi:hypothetical protein